MKRCISLLWALALVLSLAALPAWAAAPNAASSAPATRAMLCVALWEREGKPAADAAADFSDVLRTASYAEAVRWATACGITQGCGGGCFCPDDGLNREQFFTLLFRYAACMGAAAAPGIGVLDFDDAAEVSSWAVDAFRWAVQAQLINVEAHRLFPGVAAYRTLAETALERLQGLF